MDGRLKCFADWCVGGGMVCVRLRVLTELWMYEGRSKSSWNKAIIGTLELKKELAPKEIQEHMVDLYSEDTPSY